RSLRAVIHRTRNIYTRNIPFAANNKRTFLVPSNLNFGKFKCVDLPNGYYATITTRDKLLAQHKTLY
ncbi:hypothetical protein, partial [Acetobacter sp. DmW_136]|uniref:hypothetical protein n=1 Tax=Acetobacter sp. DmW_136 TaxID=2591091 RepID=UPI001EE360AB